jgi:chaperonin cofactor prefoldin
MTDTRCEFLEAEIQRITKENDKLRAQIEIYRSYKDCGNWKALHPNISPEYWKEVAQKVDMKIVEELSIAAIVKANAELKERVEVLEMAVEYLKKE